MDLRIKDICKQKGILQKDLAAKLGVTDIALRASLKGNPTLATLEKVATALGVEVSELFAPSTDFIAFIRHEGKTYTIESVEALKEFATTLE